MFCCYQFAYLCGTSTGSTQESEECFIEYHFVHVHFCETSTGSTQESCYYSFQKI